MEIRNIPYSDIPQVLEIYAQGVETGRSTFTRTVPSVEEWDKGHHPFARVGAYEGSLLIGWAALSPTSSRPHYSGVAEVSLYIRDGYRAGGVGTALLKAEMEEGEKNGIWTFYGHIFSSNKASIRMCEKAGWRLVGTREKIARDAFGVWQDTTIMEYRSKTVGID
ncbi:MAG: GNAT family N-acetyltransferase [Solobacterium sp.]|jgi:phosphinothricin acetyltransferase|nr:GNAT family N-acetyltransferase [Solobacterium sp.]